MTALSDITQIDFRSVRDVEGFASLIFASANGMGMFLPQNMPVHHKLSDLKNTAKIWVTEVERSIDSLSAGDALIVIGCFDAVHRVAFNRVAKEEYLNQYKLNAFEAYIHGDSSVDQYMLQRSISQEIRHRNSAFLDRPLQWESLCIDCWYGQFKYGRCIDRISDYDTIQRVTSLLDADLWAFETRNETRFKQSLFVNHRHYFDEAGEMDTKTLLALDRFLCSSIKYLTQTELPSDRASADPLYAYEESIYRFILSRPETNRYLKASIQVRVEGNAHVTTCVYSS